MEDKEKTESKMTEKRDSDRLGTEPVHPLLIKMSAPLAVSMFVMALYNIVDSIYLGHFSTDSLTAVSYCFPFQNLNVAFGVGTSVGMSALLSRYPGAKQYDKADKVRGMDVIVTTTAKTDEEARELLRLFGMPFARS